MLNLLKGAWTIGSSIPTLLAGPYGILIRLGLIALVCGGVFVYGYVKGGKHGEAQLEELRAGIDKERGEQAARQAERKRLSDAFITEKDTKRENDLRDAHRWWADYVERLQRDGGAGPGAKSVPATPKVCDDPARDQQLSGAIAVARSEARRAIAEYRSGIGRLLGACELQTADLIDVQGWAQYEQLLNHQPEKGPAP